MADGIMNQALTKACAYYKSRNDLLSCVKEVQEQHGYLSQENMKDIASFWGLPIGEIYGLVTFYSFLNTEPMGRNVIKVCKSISCWLKNYEPVIKIIEEQLGIKPGEMTGDGEFSLQLVNCIGNCEHAPTMMINDKVYSNLSPEKVKTILSDYKKQQSGSGGDSSRRGKAV
jgi:NADH-quinone oxidoreductase subunit E